MRCWTRHRRAAYLGLALALAPGAAKAQESAGPPPPLPQFDLPLIPGDWIRAHWHGAQGDSTRCGRLIALEPGAVRVERRSCTRRGRAQAARDPLGAAGAAGAAGAVRYVVADVPLFSVQRPREARRRGRAMLPRGMFEGAIVGAFTGAVSGVVAGLLASPSVGEGARWGAGGGAVVGLLGGGLMSYQAEYNGGWVYLHREDTTP